MVAGSPLARSADCPRAGLHAPAPRLSLAWLVSGSESAPEATHTDRLAALTAVTAPPNAPR